MARSAVLVPAVGLLDLEGFSQYTSSHGDDAALTLLAEHHRLASPIVRQWGGRIVKHTGDGLMLVFPSAASAIRASLEPLAVAPPLQLRAGLHTGDLVFDVVVTSNDLIGNVVNVAARVTALAKGGQVLVTADTLAAAGDLSDVRVLRARRRALKGFAERTTVARVERVERVAR